MRIYVKKLAGRIFPLEVETVDTIDYVKGLIKKRAGYRRLEQRLIFGKNQLDDSKVLADYNIQNESTIILTLRCLYGREVRIRTFPGKNFSVMVLEPYTINDVKAAIQKKMGIPVNEQRLVFSGRELDDGNRTLLDYGVFNELTVRLVRLRGAGDDAVDIAAVKARRKAARIGNSEKGAMDKEDFWLAWRRSLSDLIRSYDTIRYESKSHQTLIESVANDCVRTLNVTAFLDSQLQEYRDKLSQAEDEVKRLTNNMDELKRLNQELVEERSTGASFRESFSWQLHIGTLKRQAVDDFKESTAFKEIVMNHSMSIYDDVVKECQRLLRKSGRVSEDIIRLIDEVDSDQEKGEGEKGDSKKLMQELDLERSTGVSFLQSEVGRSYIVNLQRQAAESAVEEIKKSDVFEEMVINRAMSVCDDIVKECQSRRI